MNPNQALEFIPSAMRDCSIYKFRCAMLSELEFHNKISEGDAQWPKKYSLMKLIN